MAMTAKPLTGPARLYAVLIAILASLLLAAPARAANCNYATQQGATGPSSWQTYCWLDFAGYVDSTARSASGQNFSYTLPDGTVMAFNMKVSGSTIAGATSPSWSGAAVGNTAFLGISGRPILYQTAAGTTTVTISGITLTPPVSGSVTSYMLVAADGESSNNGESLSFQTNGGNWQLLDQAGPISGSTYPGQAGTGTNTFTETGVAGTVGAYVVGSVNPTSVTTKLVGGGLQGAMFAVRFASIRLTTQIVGARANPADQFSFSISATSSGSTLASATSSGTGLGPFTAAALSSTAAVPLSLNQAMAGGSVNTIAHYRSSLTCTNTATSTTPLPSSLITTSYSFGTLQFGDAVTCTFTETPFPHLTLTKALDPTGRQFAADQFVMNISQGGSVVATTTTGGSGAAVSNGSTPQYQGSSGIAYKLDEAPSGTTSLAQYTATMTCTNAASGTGTVLPSSPGGTITPVMGDVIACTITNTKRAANATLTVSKLSVPVSDPVNGSINPKLIPGALVQYSIVVQNSGPSAVDGNSILIVDSLPAQLQVGSAASPTFAQGSPGSALTFNAGTDIRYSNASTAPTSFAACTYAPVAAYDPAIRFICLNPKGAMAGSTGTAPSFTVTFTSKLN